MNKPIKRHEALKPLSREHHHGLLLCWKIRQGIKRNIEPERIKSYADWFWKSHLSGHFEAEENHVFPILGGNHQLVKRALAEHRRLKRLFDEETEVIRSLNQIEEELEGHIRFEERVLFNEIQRLASAEELRAVERHHQAVESVEDWEDEFWKEA